MVITKKHIRNPAKYLYALSPDDLFYVAVRVNVEDEGALLRYGFRLETSIVQYRIPFSHKSATTKNADGSWIIHKDRPKEPRTFERYYHVVDWHSQDHYGTCYQTRDCYPRTLDPPRDLVFTLENGVLFSPQFSNDEKNFGDIKLAINVLLEMFGRCEIWSADKAPVLPPGNRLDVPWEILRSGTGRQKDWERYIDETIKVIHKKHQTIIKQRHEYLWSRNPDFCVLGIQSFWGYVVYGFTALGLYVFECNRPDNATYVFRGDWKTASQLTKTEILRGNLHEARLLHTEKWRENLGKLITR